MAFGKDLGNKSHLRSSNFFLALVEYIVEYILTPSLSSEPVWVCSTGGFLRASTKPEEEKTAGKVGRTNSQDITGIAVCKGTLKYYVAGFGGRWGLSQNSDTAEAGV